MKIQVNTGHHIDGDEAFIANINEVVEGELGRFSDRITRVEVHLSDQNADRGGDADKRCIMEARIEGRRPISASHDAESPQHAAEGAAGKLERALATIFDRAEDKR